MISRELIDEMMGLPWSKQHCGQLAYRLLHDGLGIEVEEHDLWIDKDAPDLSRRVDEYLARQGERWIRTGEKFGPLTVIGDIAWTRGVEEFGRNHLSVVVSLDPVPTIMSTTKRSGPFLQRASQLRRVRGIYRFVG